MTHRVQLDFSDAGYTDLAKLKERADDPSNAAVIRNALAVYKWYLDTKDENADIILRRKNGETERVHFVR
jgi:hypothetical protein